LPDLEHAKAAVLNSLSSTETKRGYRHELGQIQFLLGHVSVETTERYLGCKQRIRSAVNDRIGIEPNP
jgi:integrase